MRRECTRRGRLLARGLPLGLVLVMGLLVGCRGTVAPAPMTTPVAQAAQDLPGAETLPDMPADQVSGEPVQAIPWLITAERRAAGTGDLARLAFLWAEDSRVIDRRGTAGKEADTSRHYRWEGRPAVLSRYRVAVFPHAPPPLVADALAQLELPRLPSLAEGAILSVENGADRWQFAWRGGRWWILELSYSS
ncbi:MAG: hypothetical protein WDZ49_13470 [Litorilinea sp.]